MSTKEISRLTINMGLGLFGQQHEVMANKYLEI